MGVFARSFEYVYCLSQTGPIPLFQLGFFTFDVDAMSLTEPPLTSPPAQRGGAGRRRPARTPKGRQVDPQAAADIEALLIDRPRRRDLLIEHLHLIQDHYGHLSAAHLAALAQEMKLSLTEVYEVATFYAHFDVVKDGPPPPPVTVRVCDSLSCAMAGAETLLAKLPALL